MCLDKWSRSGMGDLFLDVAGCDLSTAHRVDVVFHTTLPEREGIDQIAINDFEQGRFAAA